jgi:hypothetical protein
LEISAAVAAHDFQLTIDGFDHIGGGKGTADGFGIEKKSQVMGALFSKLGDESGIGFGETIAKFFALLVGNLQVPRGFDGAPALLKLGVVDAEPKPEETAEADPRILPSTRDAKWISLELQSGDDLPDAIRWFGRAYRLTENRRNRIARKRAPARLFASQNTRPKPHEKSETQPRRIRDPAKPIQPPDTNRTLCTAPPSHSLLHHSWGIDPVHVQA